MGIKRTIGVAQMKKSTVMIERCASCSTRSGNRTIDVLLDRALLLLGFTGAPSGGRS